MTYTQDQKWTIFMKTDGRCHYCGKQLVFANHGVSGSRGSWHIDHSFPKSKGGPDLYYNFWPACIHCNLQKSDGSARAFRYKTKSDRAARQRKATVHEINANAFPLALLAGSGITAVASSIIKFKTASAATTQGSSDAAQIRNEAWRTLAFGVLLLAFVVIFVYAVKNSRKVA